MAKPTKAPSKDLYHGYVPVSDGGAAQHKAVSAREAGIKYQQQRNSNPAYKKFEAEYESKMKKRYADSDERAKKDPAYKKGLSARYANESAHPEAIGANWDKLKRESENKKKKR